MSDEKSVVPVVTEHYMKMMEEEWRLPTSEIIKLVRVSGRVVVPEAGIRQAVDMSKAYNIPLRAIAFIPAGSELAAYVTADGFKWAYRLDARGASGILTEIIRYPTADDPMVVVLAKVSFRDGSTFTGHGVTTATQKANKDMDMGDMIMKAETKAVRRAIQNAVGIPFPVFEDAEDMEERGLRALSKTNVVEGTAVELEPEMTNMAVLFSQARMQLGLDYAAAITVVRELTNIEEPLSYDGNVQELWEKVKEKVKEKTNNG